MHKALGSISSIVTEGVGWVGIEGEKRGRER